MFCHLLLNVIPFNVSVIYLYKEHTQHVWVSIGYGSHGKGGLLLSGMLYYLVLLEAGHNNNCYIRAGGA